MTVAEAAPPPASAPEERAPYPGLRSFERDEAILFFGRNRCVDAMVDTLERKRFLAVLGASGSGKSSLVRTGLFEALEGGLAGIAGPDWAIADIKHPGGAPFRELARALLQMVGEPATTERLDAFGAELRRGPLALIDWWNAREASAESNLLVLVDQFEELFRYRSADQRDNVEAFVELLLRSARSNDADIYIVLTMRSEYLGVCALIPGLAEQINECLSLTPRMLRDECRAAIEGPSRIVGFDVEPQLVNTLLNDMNRLAPFSDRPDDGDADLDQADMMARRADQLPLMQHVLNRLWTEDRRRGVPREDIALSHAAYDKLGRLEGALSRHADGVMEEAGAPHLTEAVFKALTDGNVIATAVRRPRKFAAIAEEVGGDSPALRRVLDQFRAANFLVPDARLPLEPGTVIDLSHESLIRQWQQLGVWLQEEAEDGKKWRDLVRSTERQEQEGLAEGRRLRAYLDWTGARKPTPAWAARYGGHHAEVTKFLDDSLHEERRRVRMRTLRNAALYGTLALFVPVLWGTGYYFNEKSSRQSLVFKREADQAKAAATLRISAAELSERAATLRVAQATTSEKVAHAAMAKAAREAENARRTAAAARNEALALREDVGRQTVILAEDADDTARSSIQTAFLRNTGREEGRRILDRAGATLDRLKASSRFAPANAFAVPEGRLAAAEAEWQIGEVRPDAAEASSNKAMRAADLTGDALLRGQSLVLNGQVLLIRGKEAAARTVFDRALVVLGSEPGALATHLRAQARGSLAGLAAADNDQTQIAGIAKDCVADVDRMLDQELPADRNEQNQFKLNVGLARMECLRAEILAAGNKPEALKDAEPSLDRYEKLLDNFEELAKADSRATRVVAGLLPTMARLDNSDDADIYREIVEVYGEGTADVAPGLYTSASRRDLRAADPFATLQVLDLARYADVAAARSSRPESASYDHYQTIRLYRSLLLHDGMDATTPLMRGAVDRIIAELARVAQQFEGRPATAARLATLQAGIEVAVLAWQHPIFAPADRQRLRPPSAALLALFARSDVAEGFARFPFFLSGGRNAVADARSVCGFIGGGEEACGTLAAIDQAIERGVRTFQAERGKALRSGSKSVQRRTYAELIAYQGIDVVACADDIARKATAAPEPDEEPFEYLKVRPIREGRSQGVGDTALAMEAAADAATNDVLEPADASPGKAIDAAGADADAKPARCQVRRGFGEFAHAEGNLVYFFVSAENRRRFLENPASYAISPFDMLETPPGNEDAAPFTSGRMTTTGLVFE